MRFSQVEVVHIVVAVAAMTLAFTMALAGGATRLFDTAQIVGALPIAFLVGASFVAVLSGFLLHELAHKVVAQRYGCQAEFRYSPQGLAIGIVTAALGLMFALPGAVVIAGNVNPRQNVRISAAGPGTNLALGAAFIAIAFLLGSSTSAILNLGSVLIGALAFVNVFLGIFNLLPFPPLDGYKIFALDRPVWIAMLVSAVALYFVGDVLGVL